MIWTRQMKGKIPSWNKWRDIMTHIIILHATEFSLRKNGWFSLGWVSNLIFQNWNLFRFLWMSRFYRLPIGCDDDECEGLRLNEHLPPSVASHPHLFRYSRELVGKFLKYWKCFSRRKDSRKCSIHQKWENQEALFDPKLHLDIQENWKFIISSQTFM